MLLLVVVLVSMTCVLTLVVFCRGLCCYRWCRRVGGVGGVDVDDVDVVGGVDDGVGGVIRVVVDG